LVYDADGEALRLADVRHPADSPGDAAPFQHALEVEVGPEIAGELLYAGGFTGGQLSGRRYKEALGLSDAEAVAFMCRMGGEIGWGAFALETLAPARLVVAVTSSPFAAAYGAGDHAVCHLIRGVLGGLAAGLWNAAVSARETACAACGDEVLPRGHRAATSRCWGLRLSWSPATEVARGRARPTPARSRGV
jgi:predicted hydrocarbon binding protein